MKIDVIPYFDDYHVRWSEFVSLHPDASISHHIGFRRVIAEGLGHEPVYLVAFSSDKIVGVLPLFLVRTWWRTKMMISIPWLDYGGILADSSETAKALQEAANRMARESNVQFVEMRSKRGILDDRPTRHGKVTFQLRLSDDPNVLMQQFDGKLRNQIRKAVKSGLTTQTGGIELLPIFYKIFSWKMHQLGTPVWGYHFFELMFTYLRDLVEIIIVEKGEQPIAAGLVLTFQGTVYVPSAASYSEHLKLCPNHALYWTLIERGCRAGFKEFDFGRSTVNSNTFLFKKQWVPEPTSLEWQYLLRGEEEMPEVNPDNPKYRTMIKAWRMLPLAVANWLGPKVIRNFP